MIGNRRRTCYALSEFYAEHINMCIYVYVTYNLSTQTYTEWFFKHGGHLFFMLKLCFFFQIPFYEKRMRVIRLYFPIHKFSLFMWKNHIYFRFFFFYSNNLSVYDYKMFDVTKSIIWSLHYWNYLNLKLRK